MSGFEHDMLVYDGREEFLADIVPFVREGVASSEPVLVALDRDKIDILRAALGAESARVSYVDMRDLGVNPARIIPAWLDFVGDAQGAPCRGVGEPLWPGRTDAERAECHRHEQLLNQAFRDTDDFRLLCPYDAGGLAAGDVERARCNHTVVRRGGERRQSSAYDALDEVQVFDEPLPDPPGETHALVVEDATALTALRVVVTEHAARAGLEQHGASALVLAVNELASNSLRHADGRAEVRLWRTARALVCEVRDSGFIRDPLVGRVRPSSEQLGGRGMWLVNQLCDLVELRTAPTGTRVRLHMRLEPARVAVSL